MIETLKIKKTQQKQYPAPSDGFKSQTFLHTDASQNQDKFIRPLIGKQITEGGSLRAVMFILVPLLLFTACSGKKEGQGKVEETKTDIPAAQDSAQTSGMNMAVKMADSEMKRTPDAQYLDFREKPKWEYTNGLVCTSFLKLWKATGDKKYYNYTLAYADSMINAEGKIKTYKQSDYNIDRVNPGKFLIDLYNETGEQKYKVAIETLRDQMKEHPRTSEGGFWHKKRYPHQMWLDGLYMGSPFLVKYAANFDEPSLFDDVANQIYLIDKYAYDPETGLYYHGWDESREQKWANKETGLSANFWGRGMGWFAMALVDVLDYMPEDHPKQQMILDIANKMAAGLVKYQDTTGLWYQVVNLGNKEGNYLEASASSMFAYFLLKGVDKGYLDKKFRENGVKAYEGVLNNLIKNEEDGTISITQVCAVAGLGGEPYRSGTYEYYINEKKRDNDPKAVGPFIMASLEYDKVKNSHTE